MSESVILTDQGCQTLMNLTGNSIVQALMRPFVIVEGEVALEPGLQIGHSDVVAQGNVFIPERPTETRVATIARSVAARSMPCRALVELPSGV